MLIWKKIKYRILFSCYTFIMSNKFSKNFSAFFTEKNVKYKFQLPYPWLGFFWSQVAERICKTRTKVLIKGLKKPLNFLGLEKIPKVNFSGFFFSCYSADTVEFWGVGRWAKKYQFDPSTQCVNRRTLLLYV